MRLLKKVTQVHDVKVDTIMKKAIEKDNNAKKAINIKNVERRSSKNEIVEEDNVRVFTQQIEQLSTSFEDQQKSLQKEGTIEGGNKTTKGSFLPSYQQQVVQ